MSNTYRNQYNKITRSLAGVKLLCGGDHDENRILPDSSEEERQSLVDAFEDLFINLHSFKDWLKNDSTIPQAARDGVEAYVESSTTLKLLADVANKSKHLDLNNVRIDKDAQVANQVVLDGPMGTFPIGSFYGYSANVVTSAGTHDIGGLHFANNCLKEWENYLAAHQLPYQ